MSTARTKNNVRDSTFFNIEEATELSPFPILAAALGQEFVLT